MASNGDCTLSSDQNEEKKKRSTKSRGPKTAKYIKEKDDGPFKLEWDNQGCATGDFKNRYTTYVGAITHAKVKIWIDDWKNVEEEIKEKLWTAVKTLFLCDDDKRSYVLRDCKDR